MVKVSYCSLEEAFGEQIITNKGDDENREEDNKPVKKVYKEHFDNSQKPIEKENKESEDESSEDEEDDEEIMELKRRIEQKKRDKIKRREKKHKTSDKIQLISKDTVETYANQMVDDNEMIDLFVLFVLGVLIIYVLDYFFKLGLGK